MTAVRTPGKLFVLRRVVKGGRLQVIPVSWEQGLAMRVRGEPHVYNSATQAYTVRRRLEKAELVK